MRLAVVLGLVLTCSQLAALGEPSAPTDPPAPAVEVAAKGALNNDAIMMMAKMGFGDDVILAKIQQSPAVAFSLEVDDLTKLKEAGVTQPVIVAMINRSTTRPEPTKQDQAPPSQIPPVVVGAGGAAFSDVGAVRFVTKDHGEIELRSSAGTMSMTYAFFTMLMYHNYPGLRADVRATDRRPSLVIRSGKSPSGRMYLVSAEVDKHNDVRSVKMGNMRVFSAQNLGAPDKDNRIATELVQEGDDTWRITPKVDLRPGEYGLWVNTMELYDFGID